MARSTLTDIERIQREERAARLVWARRTHAGISSAKEAAGRYGWSVNNYKAHESGRNGFSPALGDAYADAFEVSRKWLYLNIGTPEDREDDTSLTRVPVLTTVSAGALMRADVSDEAIGSMMVADLPSGDWIALDVDGDSMDRISPPNSRIVVNRKDKQLVANACYVIDDGEGRATYKRYRPSPMRFEPVSTNPEHETIFPDNEPTVVGRVKLSILQM